jgi:hypothetical protein
VASRNNFQFVADPLKLKGILWPDVVFYRQQKEIIYSVADNDETVVVAGNMLGKDFVAGFIALWFFLTRHPVRVVTTSVDATQLEGVLWGEIRRFIQTSKYPLEHTKGGPLVVNHLNIRKMWKGQMDPTSYLRGRVSAKGEGMLGHHVTPDSSGYVDDGIPRTLFMGDEASGLDNVAIEAADTWKKRSLLIGNAYPCNNRFKAAVKEWEKKGDVKSADGKRTYTHVIRITGDDSPNVQYAKAQIEAGLEPTGENIVPGVLSWHEYVKRREVWDAIRQSIGLDARFWEGAEQLLFPPDWLDRAHDYWKQIRWLTRRAEAMGIDSAEGGDETSWAVVDERGLIRQEAERTKDTNRIVKVTKGFMREYQLKSKQVMFDRGGGGKIHADRMRAAGYRFVRTVGFGEPVSADPKHGMTPLAKRLGLREDKYVFKNRRAQMYGLLSMLLDPSRASRESGEEWKEAGDGEDDWDVLDAPDRPLDRMVGFALPPEYAELRRQLAPIPKLYKGDGRLWLPKKHKDDKDDKEPTLTELIGCSPDRADALVVAVFAMLDDSQSRVVAGGL